jgi:nucleoside-diphosphate-sugar epimerase
MILGCQGYLGSALAAALDAAGLPVVGVDVGPPAGPVPGPYLRKSFQELTAEELGACGSVVLVAGHSSVAACERAPAESFANNVADFVGLVRKLGRQRLIFASTVSVYVHTAGRLACEADPLPEPVCHYDFHKQTIERFARLAYPNSFALRFGTVCGPAPHARPELLLNSLVRAALQEGAVPVANRAASRPLLGIGDLCRAVEALVTRPIAPGCYNLASVNVRIGELAEYVARHFGVPCREVERPTPYDIRVDTRRFRAASGVEFQDTVEGLVEALAAFYVAHPEPAPAGKG